MRTVSDELRCNIKTDLLHYKVSRSTRLFTFNMVLVFTAAFLVLINLQAREEMEESKRGFYSTEADYLFCEEADWGNLEDILNGDQWMDGILFKKDLETGLDTRGVYYQGKIRKYPLRSGRIFTEKESAGNERKAVIGSLFQKEVYEQNGKEYIDILGEPFEVIGILGSVQTTRLDRMKWIPLQTAAELTGTAGNYVVDGEAGAIQHNSDLLVHVMEKDETMINLQTVASEKIDWKDWIRSVSVDTVEKIYIAIILAFILNMLLSGGYWARSRIQKIQVEKMLGFSGSRILLLVLTEYFIIAAASLAVSGGILSILAVFGAITAVSWIKCLPVIGAIILGGMTVVAVRLSADIVGRKIVLKRA